MPILEKNHLLRWNSFWSWWVCKQAKLSRLGTENPHASIEKPMHSKQVAVWCGFWFRGIIGPFFFENEQGLAVTVNDERYRAMLKEFLFTKIEEEDIGNVWFQQDGATWHTAEATLYVLRPIFDDRIISSRANVAWPPRSCDLTIICGVPSMVSVTPTSQRQLTLESAIFVKPLVVLKLHTIDNVLKNWTDRVGYYMASRGSLSNEIIFHY